MFHYLFTNDLRISKLESALVEAAKCFRDDCVPSASEDKNANNNMNTLGFYFNLSKNSNCTKACSDGNVRKVVLNFIKKFQFPNPRTTTSLKDCMDDDIRIAPMRIILQTLYMMTMTCPEEAFLSKGEIAKHIFFNEDVAKKDKPDIAALVKKIIDARQYGIDADIPDDDELESNGIYWKQCKRQVREMVKVLSWSGCVAEEDDGNIKIHHNNLSRDNEADLFEILTFDRFWLPDMNLSIEENKTLYQKYMDIELLNPEELNERKFRTWMKKQVKPKNDSDAGNPYSEGTIEQYVSNIANTPLPSDEEHSLFFTDNITEVQDCIAMLGAYEDYGDDAKTAVNKYLDYLIETQEEDMPLVFNTNLKTRFKHNRIIFGAPGTGKSYILNKERKELLGEDNETDYERVTFHPDYSYANFVGTYKPVMTSNKRNIALDKDTGFVLSVLEDESKTAQEKYDILFDKFKDEGLTRLPILLGICTDEPFETKKLDGSDAANANSVERNHGRSIRKYVELIGNQPVKNEISYEYVPGPFMRVYVNALRSARSDNPKPHLLVIEEINRANVAAVFGDVFQLLDRDENGVSEYPIQATEDMKRYLAKELGGDPEKYAKIRIPNNMFIWATMNSADQGVFPVDTAFKRRWNFTYIGIDDNDEDIRGKYVTVGNKAIQRIDWNSLRKAINNFLAGQNINEDKQLGPYFLAREIVVPKEGDEINRDAFADAFKSKVIMYLFEDAAKQRRNTLFGGCKENTSEYSESCRYSDICKKFDENGIYIFDKKIQDETDFEVLSY